MPHQDIKTSSFTKFSTEDVNLHPQILGNEKEPIQQSIKILEQHGAVGIDINMGCAVSKALKHNYGVALMGDTDYAAQVVEHAASASSLPVSVKLRAGGQGDTEFLLKFVKAIKNSGASWVTLHPRKTEQKRRGNSDWEQIKQLKANVEIGVVGNGDVQTVDDIFAMFTATNCDAVMVGRALTARPWLFWQYQNKLKNNEQVIDQCPISATEEGREYLKSLSYFVDYLERYFEEGEGVRKFQFHVRVGHVWLDYGHFVMAQLSNEKTFEGLRTRLKLLSETIELKMLDRTDLRY